MQEFYKNKKELILPCILGAIYLLYIILTWGKWGNIIADCFREIIIPDALLQGKVLYSDITCMYPPLAYQVNAVLFKLFGTSLNVLYLAGITCSAVILSLLYVITKKYSSTNTAFITVLSVMGIFTFRTIHLNSASWFFPYSYSFLYAFTACFAAFYFYLRYSETQNKNYLYLSSLLTGLSAAFKLDLILFALVPIGTAIKNRSLKDVLISVLCFFAPTLATYAIWLANGGSVELLKQQTNFLINFAKAPSVIEYNKLVLVQSINKYSLNVLSFSGTAFLYQITALTIFTGIILFINSKIKNKFFKGLLLLIAFLAGYIFIIQNIAVSHYKMNVHHNMAFLPYVLIYAALGILALRSEKHDFTYKEKFYLITTLSAFLMSYRIWAAVFISSIGNWIAILYWLALVYLLLEIMPELLPKLKESVYTKFVAIVLLLYTFSFTTLYYTNAANMKIPVISSKGTLYGGNYTKTINQTIKYISDNVSKDKTVLVADEGLVFNYLTDRKTNLKYYALIPHIIDTLGEAKVIEDLSANLPDYVLITNNSYINVGYFGKDYAKNLLEFFEKKYDELCTISENDGLEIRVLKLKD
ncbi:MAG: hypothetical protein K6C94_00720 [Candidatus Gastranaerophilales bacterium]|nr:hypothetical protein [Candidatus Gastranaerophilales bacterium]